MTSSSTDLPRILGLGLVVFIVGLIAARSILPEWRQDALPVAAFYEPRLAEIQEDLGLLSSAGPARFSLSGLPGLRHVYRQMGSDAGPWLEENRCGVVAAASFIHRWDESPRVATRLIFAGDGVVWRFDSAPVDWSAFLPGTWPSDRRAVEGVLARALAGEAALGDPQTAEVVATGTYTLHPLVGEDAAIVTQAADNWVTVGSREPGSTDEVRAALESAGIGLTTSSAVIIGGRFLLVLIIFVTLLVKRRLGLVNAVVLAGAVLLTSVLAGLLTYETTVQAFFPLAAVLAKTLLLFLLWAAAESWLRATIPGFSTSFDVLRAGRLGPRGGRSLIGGWALGATQAGLGLGLFALAVRLPGVYPTATSVVVPIWSDFHSPLGAGLMSAGFVLLALAICRNVLSAAWVVPVAAAGLATVLNLPQTSFAPWHFALVAALAINGLYVFAFQRFGLTGLLAAALTAEALPAVLFASLHLSWMWGSFVVTALLAFALPVLGWIALQRPSEPEKDAMVAPAYIRRLEEERRIFYEMKLLARMQRGLLPPELPEVEGYQLAATSILAAEASGDLYDFLHDEDGGLWVAAGDVSGHGLPCTIEHAMTKAALASLIRAGRRPADILQDVDRVLRTARAVRSFTSLCLLRLEPASGRIVFSNAGHPYPLLIDGLEMTEISLPSLPLGQGPRRVYEEQTFHLHPGSALVLLSDGLFESPDRHGEAYGFARVREVLAQCGGIQRQRGFSAAELLTALISDWRAHVGSRAPADDTTLVVLKRVDKDP